MLAPFDTKRYRVDVVVFPLFTGLSSPTSPHRSCEASRLHVDSWFGQRVAGGAPNTTGTRHGAARAQGCQTSELASAETFKLLTSLRANQALSGEPHRVSTEFLRLEVFD